MVLLLHHLICRQSFEVISDKLFLEIVVNLGPLWQYLSFSSEKLLFSECLLKCRYLLLVSCRNHICFMVVDLWGSFTLWWNKQNISSETLFLREFIYFIILVLFFISASVFCHLSFDNYFKTVSVGQKFYCAKWQSCILM